MNLLDHLRAMDLRVNPIRGWETRGRPGGTNYVGVGLHHTAGGRHGNAPSLNVCIHGRSGLPGPLYGILIGRDQTVHLIAIGRHNHIGMGSSVVLNETRRGVPPSGDAAVRGLRDDIGGNAHYYGISCEHVGTSAEPWTGAMIETAARCGVAVMRWLDITNPLTAIQHREWTRRKIDMSWRGSIRERINARMDYGREESPMPERKTRRRPHMNVTTRDCPEPGVYAIGDGTEHNVTAFGHTGTPYSSQCWVSVVSESRGARGAVVFVGNTDADEVRRDFALGPKRRFVASFPASRGVVVDLEEGSCRASVREFYLPKE